VGNNNFEQCEFSSPSLLVLVSSVKSCRLLNAQTRSLKFKSKRSVNLFFERQSVFFIVTYYYLFIYVCIIIIIISQCVT